MSLCHKCGRPVFFAERRSSIGKEWHRECLRCGECNKVLHPGQHAEHKGVPYCNVPCYRALFGPTMYGHGSPVEAHRNFGRPSLRSPKESPIKRSDLNTKLKGYNAHHEGRAQISSREVNGRIVLEGLLRIHWGVVCPIQLQPKDDDSLPKTESWRRSYHMAINNGLDEDLKQFMDDIELGLDTLKTITNGRDSLNRRKSSIDDLYQAAVKDTRSSPSGSPLKGPNQDHAQNVVLRKDRGRRRRSNRLSIFSGHEYNLETSVFIPAHDSVTNVHVTSLDATQEVVQLLLDKFKVVNNPEDFCLSVVKNNGETRVLRDDNFPLLERVMLGPLEDEAKLFIMEKHRSQDISVEVAQFVNLPEPVLQGFILKLNKDEEDDEDDIKSRYIVWRQQLQYQLDQLAVAKDR